MSEFLLSEGAVHNIPRDQLNLLNSALYKTFGLDKTRLVLSTLIVGNSIQTVLSLSAEDEDDLILKFNEQLIHRVVQTQTDALTDFKYKASSGTREEIHRFEFLGKNRIMRVLHGNFTKKKSKKKPLSEAVYRAVPSILIRRNIKNFGKVILDSMGLEAGPNIKVLGVDPHFTYAEHGYMGNRSFTLLVDMKDANAPYESEQWHHLQFLETLLDKGIQTMFKKYVGVEIYDHSLTFPFDYKEGTILFYGDLRAWKKE